jgi:malate dehydrogenase (oxaloacetate-decarboxylating)(NADP+)
MLYANEHELSGIEILHDPYLNKGTAFTEQERDALGLRGLLPPHVATMEEQVHRVMEAMRAKPSDLEKHIFLIGLQERNRTLFYRVVIDHLEEIMPLIYTPTVGKACQDYGHIFRRPQGLFISIADKGRVAELLDNWMFDDVRVIVVTDGERILGLGDLGANGMGIPVGKLSLYVSCAGINPRNTLPITLDVGTTTETILNDPLYLGIRRQRVRGAEYDELIEEFVQAVKSRFPQALLQWEDFGNSNAFRLLAKYREQITSFNDDIQGTAAVTVAGILSAMRITGKPLAEQKILFLGAGEAGIGIGDLLVASMVEAGIDPEEARNRCWFVDSKGLVVKSRTDLQAHKLPYSHEASFVPDLLTAVEMIRPTAIIGVSGMPRTFDKAVVEAMSRINERPIIFALSNPTSKSECTAEEAYSWSKGRSIFASGSPFDPVVLNGTRFVPGQANNSYVFPGIGLGVLVSQATKVTDEMFLAAAQTLAGLVDEEDLVQGRIFPPLPEIRSISARIAASVAQVAQAQGIARAALPEDLISYIEAQMYNPLYPDYA